MSVKLTERAVDNVWTLFRAFFGTELALVEADRADGVTLPVPAADQYYNREHLVVLGGTVHVEVFDPQGFQFRAILEDVATARATYTCPIQVRLTCFNRDGVSADTMEIRRRRYQAAMFNTVAKRTTGFGDSSVVRQGWPTELLDPVIERGEDGGVLKFQTSLIVTLSVEEEQS